jgi:hypothetical protein
MAISRSRRGFDEGLRGELRALIRVEDRRGPECASSSASRQKPVV